MSEEANKGWTEKYYEVSEDSRSNSKKEMSEEAEELIKKHLKAMGYKLVEVEPWQLRLMNDPNYDKAKASALVTANKVKQEIEKYLYTESTAIKYRIKQLNSITKELEA